ncbi:hypothetical protein D5086_033356 [Populus alba]|uniref:Uncharacterized protein n=1 Tax=Populus alba TaxID=43335 RepID=A0ACC4AGP5_POPAL
MVWQVHSEVQFRVTDELDLVPDNFFCSYMDFDKLGSCLKQDNAGHEPAAAGGNGVQCVDGKAANVKLRHSSVLSSRIIPSFYLANEACQICSVIFQLASLSDELGNYRKLFMLSRIMANRQSAARLKERKARYHMYPNLKEKSIPTYTILEGYIKFDY